MKFHADDTAKGGPKQFQELLTFLCAPKDLKLVITLSFENCRVSEIKNKSSLGSVYTRPDQEQV